MRRSALRRTLRLVGPHTRGSRTVAAGGLGALLAEVAFRLAEPWPIAFVIDLLVARVPAAGATLDSGGLLRPVLLAGLAVLLIAVGRAAAAYLSSIAFAIVGSATTTRLRAAVNDRLLHAGPDFHHRNRTGDLVTRVVSDVGRVQEAAITAGLPLLGSVLTFVAMGVVMLVLDPVMALVVVGVLPLLLLTGHRSGGRITDASREQRHREGALASDAAEAFSTIGFLQAYDLQGVRARVFSRANEGSLREGLLARRLAAGLERRVDVVVGLATAVVLVFGALRIGSGALSVGDLVVFLTYLKAALKPVRDLAKHTGRIARAAASGERVADALDEAEPLPDPARPEPARVQRGEVEFRGITLVRRDRHVLDGADLRIRAGERVAVVGPSGCGKSSTLQLLLRLLDPDAGQILLDGQDVTRVRRAELRDRLAVVLQEPVIVAGTVAENVRLGRPEADDAAVRAAVRAAGAHDFVAALPQGYDTPVAERGGTLSGGQRQRLAIARAMLRDPAVLLLDEPTTGLDAASAATVLTGLQALAAGRTTVLVTHDETLLAGCDRVLELRGGRFVERVAAVAR
ncbi:ABC transporter ATP-binding protein [Kineococcus gynurae]|uniref:ABC transporter ATP-binding protein n=1 Tax=Kineococcus gynurae TaxID=452979 RepID=A0ABV5LXD9_9ACTN